MGSFQANLRTHTPELEHVCGKITGTGASAPTRNSGLDLDGGPVLARTGVGTFTLTFPPGTKEAYPTKAVFWATTPANVDRFDAVFGEYDSTTRVLNMTVYNDAGTVVDLAAATGLYLHFFFRSTTLAGGK